MSDLKSWFEGIDAAVAAIGEEPALGITAKGASGLTTSMAETGFPGVLPLWSARSFAVGLMAMPEMKPRAWPVVLYKDGKAVTLAGDTKTALPRFLVHRLLSNNPEEAERFMDRLGDTSSKALVLHDALGGDPRSFEVFVEAASAPSSRRRFDFKHDQIADFEAAHSELFRKIDLSPSFGSYADWLDAEIDGERTRPDIQAHGIWARQSIRSSVNFAATSGTDLLLTIPQLIEIVEQHAGLDVAVPKKPTWAITPGGKSAIVTIMRAVSALNDGAPLEDPIERGLVEALVEQDADYNGYAHAEAVVALDESGRPERAWGALHSAAWWTARSTGEMPTAMLDGARLLADRHGWEDIRFVLDRVGGAKTP